MFVILGLFVANVAPLLTQAEKFDSTNIATVNTANEVVKVAPILTAREVSPYAISSVTDTSIGEQLVGATVTNLVVVPSPTGEMNKEYPSTSVGLKSALYDLYVHGNNSDFAIYIGTNITNLNGADAKAIPITPSATNMTFAALKGKVNNLVITGTPADTITTSTAAVSGARSLTFAADAYFGSNLVLRNINYSGTDLFMEGHNLSLNGGSRGNGLNIFGGSDTTDVIGSPVITVNANGTGTWNIYGGNQNGGNLVGNVTLNINNTVGAINTLAGGARIGTITGNVTVNVTETNGVITNFYGGGEGTGTANTANVTGDVTSSINNPNTTTNMRIGAYHGGVNYGDISGTVSNTISGYGGWSGTLRDYYGGSAYGNIGSAAIETGIITNLDTSKFSTGTVYYNGANTNEGTIRGDIRNTIKAGKLNAGSIIQINGAGGRSVTRLTNALNGSTDLAAYDAMTPQARKEAAETGARFKVYGDIYTDVLGGAVSQGGDDIGFTKGFGWGGYLEGNTYVTMGTLRADGKTGGEGMAYDGDSINATVLANALSTGLSYEAAPNRSSFAINNAAQFDIVGGGGSIGAWTSDVFIQGDTNVVLNNTIARWTYGAGFSGVTQGNTNITLNGGFVDTLEGAGYYDRRIFGNTKAIVNDGQVDWFLSGGGWTSLKVIGDASVDVYDGVVNASMGASYGDNAQHTIDGDSHMFVYGGDFSGIPRTGNNSFSAGITNNGTLTGNSNLTLDLRDYEGTFKFPTGTFISAGKPYNVNTYLGTDATNTMNLNIFADETSGDVLNGADIYGDGGAAANTKSGKININIDAPGSTIGNLYSTQYSNISSNRLLRNVTLNVQRAKSINGISGGNAADNITNTVAANSAAATPKIASTFVFGADVSGNQASQTDPINITGSGLNNFTDLTVQNKTVLSASGGNIRNGSGATAANHGTTYNQFGDIHLKENSGLGVSTATNYISAGKLTIEGEGTLESGQGAGIINISDIDFDDSNNDRLTWIKNTTTTTGTSASNGSWFGSNTAFRVLTINPTISNASKVTPFNFMGREKATGKTYIGDNDVTQVGSGYGIMIPGSVIDYEVVDPVVDGDGAIEHNVATVKPNNNPVPLSTWGTEIAGEKVQKGRLIIPLGSGTLPELTFTPEVEESGSWLYGANIVTTKVGSAAEVITERDNSEPVNWQSGDGQYSYTVKIRYSNKAELSARSVILTESQAAQLADVASIQNVTEVKGRPFLHSNITNDMVNDIQQPLTNNQFYRKTTVNYDVGTANENPTNVLTETVTIVVIKNGATISQDKHYAVYAQDAEMRLNEAQGLASQSVLESEYTHAFVIDSAGVLGAVESDPAHFTTITGLTSEDVPKDVLIDYSFDTGSGLIEKSITVSILPSLAELKIRFIGEDDTEIATTISRQETIGETVDLADDTEVEAVIDGLINAHYQISVRPSDEEAILIEAGGTAVTYRFVGTIFINSGPALIDFGSVSIIDYAKQINADEANLDNPLIIQDTRMGRQPWKITATVIKEMTNDFDLGDVDVQTGALRYRFMANEVVLSDEPSLIYSNDGDTQDSLFNISNRWGDQDSDEGLKLRINSNRVPKTIGSYSGTIRWTLESTIE